MRARALLILSAVLLGPAFAAQTPAQRARAFAALPDWTGLWETEASARLTATGRLEPPKLWGKLAATATDLPSAVKVCEPAGFPAMMEHPVPDHLFEMLITPEQTLLVTTDGAIRHIYTDGRPHPTGENLWPTAEGHSIGRWEGDTLVIDTVARKAGPVGPPLPGVPVLSEQARFTERLRLLDADTLQNEMTIEDPQRLAGRWQIEIRYARVRNVDRMIPVNCRENDRNPVVDGKFVITPP